MARPLFIFFLLLHLLHATTRALQKGDQQDLDDFSRLCPPQRCANGGPEIRFPFRLQTSPPSCGSTGLVLSCSGNRPILPLSQTLTLTLTLPVLAINYSIGLLTVKIDDPSSDLCPLQDILLLNFSSSSNYYPNSKIDFSVVNCSRNISITDDGSYGNFVPISCLGAGFVYAVSSSAYMDVMPPYCAIVLNDGWIPFSYLEVMEEYDLASMFDAFDRKREIYLRWNREVGIGDQCTDCEFNGGRCGFNAARNRSFCFRTEQRRSNSVLIIATSVGGASAILMASILFFYMNTKSGSEEEMLQKIENFLATYQNSQPTRYTYSEIKKITLRFKHKVGQGGFGTVYRGELPNGIPVAVKMIETANNDGEEFINEVATISRIHHVNVVRLLGFCSEGSRRSLVYEFMPNESLEKFIFSKVQELGLEKLLEIAVGIAQGIEYLHQGCDLRILHFDIKPHNILLDHSFVPKISDFGLAKLCSRDQSMVTMTAARGTMGYIAPEIYSRNFGNVSYKSDVYSFGMLLLEMVSGRKNVDPSIEDQSVDYFPEWVYDQLVRERDLGPTAASTENGEEIAKKLVIVALWCIQWSPVNRPTMTRVVQMLLGELRALEIPPKPFASSGGLENVFPVNHV